MINKVHKEQIYERSENCLLEEMDDEILLYNPQSNITLHLNESSALIWKMIDGESSVGALIEVLAENYPEAKGQIQGDVTEFMQQLLNESAIVLITPE